MDTTRKRREKKEKFWKKANSNEKHDQKKVALSRKGKKEMPKVKLVIPSRGKSGRK